MLLSVESESNMRNVNNSVETVNAAASAIVNAESRVQPSSVQKRRWAKCWSLSCFGAQKNNNRIVNAVLVPEPVAASSRGAPVVTVQNSATSTTTVLPFIAPPSSPASFLQSDPSSLSHSPSLTGNTFSPKEPQSVFTVGPYANETQPVTPPVFSAFITEPSTAPFTPPPESSSVHIATPSSPEVPFAQLLTSSLELTRRDSSSGMNQKFSKSHYEFRSNQVCPGSPGGGNLISPGSVISNSGTSSPYPGKSSPLVEFRIGEPPKFLGFEHFTARKWGSRFGSGSITPVGHGSGMVSGALTPNSTAWPQISEVASLANSDHGSEVVVADHRVSFELTGEDVARCLASKLNRSHDRMNNNEPIETEDSERSRNRAVERVSGDVRETEQQRIHKLSSSSSIGSSKEFKFDNTKEENIEKVAGNSWSFFPGLRSGVS
ncbi:unnamed protein product [Microthlaspi erraticum]|uniref:Hydroxyproline-rich glycoprotein family protein n=1 Tax=Microthlaspi erraticum TaxID=1685480 RepID=A0A6D2L5F4_9BRAS|nr:unnamed protein product [Microthlaspi erraticum]